MDKTVAVIICAAGPASRFGGKRKKQFTDVRGRAVFMRSVEAFADHPDVKQVLLGIPQEDDEIVCVKWGANLQFFGVKTFFGGGERFETVASGLDLVRDDVDMVAVHDGCRCCVTEKLITDVFSAAARSGAALPACPITATVKRVRDGVITETVDRSDLYEAQTPQVFETALLKEAYARLDNADKNSLSDDAQLVEALGHEVAVVETDSSNVKITHRSDLAVAEAIIKAQSDSKPKGPQGPFIEAQW